MNEARGFTLIEMLVVISILSILIGLVVVGALSAREIAREKRVLAFAGQVERVLAADCGVVADFNDDPDDGSAERCGEGATPNTGYVAPVQTQGIAGVDDTAYYFSGASTSIVWENVASVGKSWTMQAWVKPDDTVNTGQRPMFFVFATVSQQIYFYQENRDIVGQIVANGNNLLFEVEDVLTAGEWTHVLFSYDGIAERAYVYIDDKLVKNEEAVGVAFDVTEQITLFVGGDQFNYFEGSMDNVRIYAETTGSGF